VRVVPPGVDLELFTVGDVAAARAQVGLPQNAHVLLFVGRIQPLKAPDVVLRAAADLLARRPELRQRLVVAVIGGPSGSGLGKPRALQELAQQLGIQAQVRFVPPVDRATLALWYRAADLVTVPSYSESFGLVALEAQACGTPVVAAAVGGLPFALGDSGLLINGHETADWSAGLEGLLDDPRRREVLSRKAVEHASQFGWERTTDRLLEVYAESMIAKATSAASPMDGSTSTASPIDEARGLTGVTGGGDPVTESTPEDSAAVQESVRLFLDGAAIEWELGGRAGEYVVSLPGEKKLKTVCSVVVGEQSLSISAFVVRNPDENHAAVYAYLLRRNLKLPGLAYGIDRSGDVFVTGRVPLQAVTAAYLDQIFGVVLDAADGAFNELLAMGFLESMKKEWAWRISRGESTRNLDAFRHLLETAPEGPAPSP